MEGAIQNPPAHNNYMNDTNKSSNHNNNHNNNKITNLSNIYHPNKNSNNATNHNKNNNNNRSNIADTNYSHHSANSNDSENSGIGAFYRGIRPLLASPEAVTQSLKLQTHRNHPAAVATPLDPKAYTSKRDSNPKPQRMGSHRHLLFLTL